METEATLLSARDQHLASESAGKSPEQALATLTAEPGSRTQNGAEAILDLLRANGTDCVFASHRGAMVAMGEAKTQSVPFVRKRSRIASAPFCVRDTGSAVSVASACSRLFPALSEARG